MTDAASAPAAHDSTTTGDFRKLLARNIALPLALSLLGGAVFVGIVFYLLAAVQWVEHTDQVIARAYRLQKLTLDQETGARGYLLTGQPQFLEPYEQAATPLAQESAELSRLVADNPAQAERLGRIESLRVQWQQRTRPSLEARRTDPAFVDRDAEGRRQITDAIRTEFDQFIAIEQALRKARSETLSRNTVTATIGYGAFLLITGGFIALFGRRSLVGLSGTFDRNLTEQRALSADLSRLAWLREGQAILASRLAGELSLAEVGRNTLEILSDRLGSAVGAMYVSRTRAAGSPLDRLATWAWEPTLGDTTQTLAPGRTLVAECAAQRKVMQLEPVPTNYLRVSSGLGAGSVASVLLAPVEFEGQLLGVVELGFLRPLAERDAQLMELVSANIGSCLQSARLREQVQSTLEETQQLNEELQTQQEELRTANEELEEQTRALKESQAALQTQQIELEQTNEQLAEQRDLLDLRNEALHNAQSDLQQRAAELQRASQYKSEFLANMSHELRTPLNSSLILARLLADNAKGNLDEEQVRFAESIYSAGNDLLTLINDILDIAKVEAGKLEMRPEVVALESLTQALVRTFEPMATQRQLRFRLELGPELPPTLYTDRQRLEQVLKNLLSNAVKFTDSGEVALRVARHGQEALLFEVQDTGIGIPPDQQGLIFEAFRQADGTLSRRHGGTGLGLSISRDLARLLGGGIAVQSTPGQGSRFTLTLPVHYQAPADDDAAAPAATAAPTRQQHPALAPQPSPGPTPSAAPALPDDRDQPGQPGQRHVLVVEDDTQFARILLDLAHEMGYRCTVAQGSHEAIELAGRLLPDAVLLDMRLPDASGLAVLQFLKDTPRTRHIPVHVISVEDMSEAALQMGAIGYAKKPATREQLRQVFAKLEAKLAQELKRVLVVEDDDAQREGIARLIGDSDIEIVAVDRGEKALALLRQGSFDCMVTDLQLPDMPGAELLKRMAAEGIGAFPPVIVYTGRNLTRQEEADLQRYSRSIIIKGARSPERLLDEVTLFLHKVESDLSSDRQRLLKLARNRDKAFEGRRILLVDDDVRNIFALTSALELKGASVEVARSGEEALAKLARVDSIDLVLMDIMMPGMDGYTATREIRKDGRWRKLPIIAVTAKAMKDDQRRCLEAGANDYLAKPIDLDRLFSLIRVWLPKIERL